MFVLALLFTVLELLDAEINHYRMKGMLLDRTTLDHLLKFPTFICAEFDLNVGIPL